MKRLYFVHRVDECTGFMIVAESSKKAKKIGYCEDLDLCEWTEIRVRWVKEHDVSDMECGIVKDCEGL